MAEKSEKYKQNQREYQRRYRREQREKVYEVQKRYRINNSEKYKQYQKEYHLKNNEKRKEQSKEYWKNNKEKQQEYFRNYREQNKHKINERKKDPKRKLISAIRGRIKKALKQKRKPGSSVRDLGCTISELKQYLESKFQPGMTWENWSYDGWHLDHIIPIASFDLENREEFLKAINYTNLQPLWAKEHRKKTAQDLGYIAKKRK